MTVTVAVTGQKGSKVRLGNGQGQQYMYDRKKRRKEGKMGKNR